MTDSIQHHLRQACLLGELPACSLSLRRDGDLAFIGGFGWEDSAETRPADAETLFPIASVTKPFTAGLLLNALKTSGTSAKSLVQDMLPDFQLNHPDASGRLRITDLLHHQSPLPPHTWAWVFSGASRADFIRDRLPFLSCHPDTVPQYRYSNLMYAVCGRVCEVLAGESWEELLNTQTIQPLRLPSLRPLDSAWSRHPRMAQAHSSSPLLPAPPFHAHASHLIAPASELAGSVQDLDLWLQNVLVQEPWRELEPVLLNPQTQLYARAGWRYSPERHGGLIWHSGQCSGYTALVAVHPSTKRTFSALCNRSNAFPVLEWLLEKLLNLSADRPVPRPHISASPPGEEPSRNTPGHIPSGIYHHPGYGRIEILEPDADGKQQLFFNEYGKGPLQRTPSGRTVWIPDGYRAQIFIQESKNGLHADFGDPSSPIEFTIEMQQAGTG